MLTFEFRSANTSVFRLKFTYSLELLRQDLENCMRKHPESRLQHIQEIGHNLIGEQIMSVKMKSDVDDVTNRWTKLSQQVCGMFRIRKLSNNLVHH